MIDYLRLAFGTVVVLLPAVGRARARAARRRPTLAWSLAASFVAWAVVFTVHARTSGSPCCVLARSRSRPRSPARPSARASAAGSRGRGWRRRRRGRARVVPLARRRRRHRRRALPRGARAQAASTLGDLHLRTVDEFKDGGLHPGYAFPLWHGFLALVAWFSGLDPDGRRAPRAVAAGADRVPRRVGGGRRRLRLAAGGRRRSLVATLALFCFAPAHGGSYAVARAAGDRGAAAARARGDRALLHGVARGAATRRVAAIFGAIALVASHLRALPADPARRDCCAWRVARRGWSQRSCRPGSCCSG